MNITEQLEKISGGYPVITEIFEHQITIGYQVETAVDATMTKLIERFNPPQLQVPMIRIIVEKLSLINMEFRPDDLSSYLFPHESKSPIEIREIFSGLSQMGIISYGTKGYGLDISLLHLARQHIQLHLTESKYQEYIGALKECQQKLISSYPNASNWYQNMIYPIDQI